MSFFRKIEKKLQKNIGAMYVSVILLLNKRKEKEQQRLFAVHV